MQGKHQAVLFDCIYNCLTDVNHHVYACSLHAHSLFTHIIHNPLLFTFEMHAVCVNPAAWSRPYHITLKAFAPYIYYSPMRCYCLIYSLTKPITPFAKLQIHLAPALKFIDSLDEIQCVQVGYVCSYDNGLGQS